MLILPYNGFGFHSQTSIKMACMHKSDSLCHNFALLLKINASVDTFGCSVEHFFTACKWPYRYVDICEAIWIGQGPKSKSKAAVHLGTGG